MLLRIIFSSMALAYFSVAFCQQPDTIKSILLQEAVVSPSRTEIPLRFAPRSISTLNEKELGQVQYNHLGDALFSLPGISISGSGQIPGSLQTLYIRGSAAHHSLIMLDGVRISDPTSPDAATDLSELSPFGLSRLELLRGSHSTLYGSAAIGGVLNLFSSLPEKTGLGAHARLDYGRIGPDASGFIRNARLANRWNNGLFVSGEVWSQESLGLDATVLAEGVTPNYQHMDRSDDFSRFDIAFRGGILREKFRAIIGFRSQQQDAEIDDAAYTDDENNRLGFRRELVSLNTAWTILPALDIEYAGGITFTDRTNTDDSSRVDVMGNTDNSFFRSRYQGQSLSNNLQLRWKRKCWQAIAGAWYEQETMNAETYYLNTAWMFESTTNLDSLDITASLSAAFLHVRFDGSESEGLWKSLALDGGIRINHHSRFGAHTTYSLNPSLRLSKSTLLFASLSTGFSAPSLYRLYSPETDYVSGISRGNPLLRPETSATWELGLRKVFGEEAWFAFSWFSTQVEDFIEYVYLWNPSVASESLGFLDYRGDTYINAGSQHVEGLEFSFSSDLSSRWHLSGNFSLINGSFTYRPVLFNPHTGGQLPQVVANGRFLNTTIETAGLPRRPSTASAILSFNVSERLQFRADWRYASQRNDIRYNSGLGPYGALDQVPVAGYSLLDFRAFYTWRHGLSAQIRAENVFNTPYTEIVGYATRGRALWIGLRWDFQRN